VNLEDALASLRVGLGHLDETVEPARPEDGAVEHVEAVGGGDDADLPPVVEPVHLREQLHHRALDLRVAGGLRLGTGRGNGVDLVDKDDSGLVLGGEFEQVTHQARALADELLDELGASHLDERGVCLVCDGLRQHRLAGAGRAVQQHAGGRVDTDRIELLGADERLFDGLADLADLLFESADVVVHRLGALFDLHRLCAGVCLGLQHRS
jgi:hypothetical protein